MKKTILIISEEFENEKTGEKVEGITIIVDGSLKEFLDIIKTQKLQYKNNVSVIQDALMQGLEKYAESFSYVAPYMSLKIKYNEHRQEDKGYH